MASNWPTLPAFQDEASARQAAPQGWDVSQIERIYEPLPIGQRRDKKSCTKSGHVPVIDQSAEGCVGYHNDDPGVEASNAQPVITFANHTCEMRVMREPFSVIQNVFPMVGADGVCDTLFFYYATKGRVNIEEYKGHYPDFRRLWIPIPPLSEQRAIAEVLGSLDDKIALNRRMNRTLESMARALFKSWFVDFDPVHANAAGQPTLPPDLAALFPTSFEPSPLGEIPEGWEVRKVGDCINRQKVGPKYDQKTASSSGNVPILDQGKSGIIGYHCDEPGVFASLQEPVAVFANHTCYMRLITFPFSTIQNVLPFTGKGIDTVWAYYATLGLQSFIEYKGHWPDFIINEVVVPAPKLTEEFRQLQRFTK